MGHSLNYQGKISSYLHIASFLRANEYFTTSDLQDSTLTGCYKSNSTFSLTFTLCIEFYILIEESIITPL